MTELTTEEISFFRINGYVIKRGAIDSDLISRCRERVWENITEGKDDPQTWPDGGHATYRTLPNDKDYTPWATEKPFVDLMNAQRGYAEQLVGSSLETPSPGYVVLRFPDKSGATYSPPGSGHLDTTWGMSVATALLLDRVDPQGGGYNVWPGSHLIHHQIFQMYDPKSHDISRNTPAPWQTGGGVEFTGEAGDMAVVHPWMLHTVGHNLNDNVRMLTLTGWRRTSVEEDYSEISSDLWWYWEGMKKIEARLKTQNSDWPPTKSSDTKSPG